MVTDANFSILNPAHLLPLSAAVLRVRNLIEKGVTENLLSPGTGVLQKGAVVGVAAPPLLKMSLKLNKNRDKLPLQRLMGRISTTSPLCRQMNHRLTIPMMMSIAMMKGSLEKKSLRFRSLRLMNQITIVKTLLTLILIFPKRNLVAHFARLTYLLFRRGMYAMLDDPGLLVGHLCLILVLVMAAAAAIVRFLVHWWLARVAVENCA